MNDNFTKDFNKKYKKYTIPKKKKTFHQICFPKSFELQPQQELLSKYIHPNTNYKSLLIFHQIGAGKTCTAIRIAEEWKHKRKIIVVVPASLKENFRSELRSQCAGNDYLTKLERNKLKDLHVNDQEYKDIISKSNDRINKHYIILSYNKFIEKCQENDISFHKKVLIIDEIQNMISEHGTYYKTVYNSIMSAPKDLRIILLSATPIFDKPNEIGLTLNLLRIPNQFPSGTDFFDQYIRVKKIKDKTTYNVINIDDFKDRIKGYVSYYRGAPPYVFPELSIKYVKCPMSDFQYKCYKTILKNDKFTNKGTIFDMTNDFFIGTRIISNIAFPNKKTGEEGLDSLLEKHILNKLDKYSIKFYKIMKKIKSTSGTIFIYSNFKEYGGIKSFIKILETYGYKNYLKHNEGRKRYAVWSGEESTTDKEKIRTVFNMYENINGSKIKIILGSPSIKEGVSFKNVSQVHIIEPYWNESRLSQVIGRASRFCSHKDVDEDQRNVKVYIYISVHEDEDQTIDQYILNLAKTKQSIISKFELALKESAIDCELFKHANVFSDEDDIECVR